MGINVGDVVEYTRDWKPGRQWYVYSLRKGDLCTIVLLRDGKYMHEKRFKSAGYEWTETYLNASIVNINISNLKKI